MQIPLPFDPDTLIKLAAPLVTVCLATWKHLTDRKPKLVTYYNHSVAFNVKNKTGEGYFPLHTHTITVGNIGKRSAENVRLGHNLLAEHIEVFPKIKHEIEPQASGGGEIVFPSLVPNEKVTVSYLYFPPVTWNQINSYVKSDEGFAKQIEGVPAPQPPRIVSITILALAFVGASFCIYWLLKLAFWLAS